MKVAVFSTKGWVRSSFDQANSRFNFELTYLDARLDEHTVSLAAGMDAICAFVNDSVDAVVLGHLNDLGVKQVALRSAGFNNVDLEAARKFDISIVRVPAYSPFAVAEHAMGLVLALTRRLHKAYNRTRDGNFSLEGLLGFDINSKSVGIVGTGRIGQVFARIAQGFGCSVLAYDKYPNDQLVAAGVRYVELDQLYRESDIISLHCPLTHETYHLINKMALTAMKPGVMIINTSRGPLIDTPAVIEGLKSGHVGYLGLDVYEEEGDLFFEDFSDQVIQDDVFVRLQTFPNVLITAHQAFFTREAIDSIAMTTLQNLTDLEQSGTCQNLVHSPEA